MNLHSCITLCHFTYTSWISLNRMLCYFGCIGWKKHEGVSISCFEPSPGSSCRSNIESASGSRSAGLDKLYSRDRRPQWIMISVGVEPKPGRQLSGQILIPYSWIIPHICVPSLRFLLHSNDSRKSIAQSHRWRAFNGTSATW